MTIKQFIQTRWQIKPHQLILYPYGSVSIMAVLFAVVGVGWMLMMVHVFQESFKSVFAILWPVALFYLLIILFFAMFAGTKIIFDQERQLMYKLLLGFIKTTTLPFSEISGIQLLRSGRGTFRYYVLHKNPTSWNISTGISSGVINKDSAHAQQFETEVLPVIKKFLHTHSVTSSTNYRKK